MPELPEVQTVVNDLQKLAGDTITGFWTNWKRAFNPMSAALLEKKIKGKKIVAVKRLSKFIVLDLSSKESLLLHLRMTGKLIVNEQQTINNNQQNVKQKSDKEVLEAKSYELKANHKHLHHIFYLKKHGALEFHDIRKFGTIDIRPTSEIVPKKFKLGIDPFDKNFSAKYFARMIQSRPKKPIKDLLLDQGLISGIGNIYASEILFDCKILPNRKALSLSGDEIKKLHESVKKILKKAIRMRGTSISDYRDGNGKKGSFQKVLKVYKKHGQECVKCGTIIAKSIIGQRSTFYCPACQK